MNDDFNQVLLRVPSITHTAFSLYLLLLRLIEVKAMFVAIEENDVKAVRTYLQRNVHPDTLFETNVFEENVFTWGALHAAAYYGAKGIINLLMEFNANVELQDTWYKGRPLAWAAFGGKSRLSRELLLIMLKLLTLLDL